MPTPRYSTQTQQLARNALGLPAKDAKRYSLSRAMLAAAGEHRLDGLEKECHDEIVQRAGETRQQGGVYIPTADILVRDLTAATAANGGYLVGTDHHGESFVDLLRNRAVVGQMGATVMSRLKGNVTIPKLTNPATAYWLANEATAITESTQTLGQLSLTPKNVGALTEFSRQLLLQSSPSVDTMIANDLARVIALAVDAAAINGSGSGGEPLGLLGTSGIGSVTGTSMDLAKLLEFQADVAGSNAMLEGGSLGYVTTPAVAALLAQRFSNATYGDKPLWDGNLLEGRCLGFKGMTSMQIPAGKMIFGDWSQLILGEWGQLEIASNPFQNFAGGILAIRAIQTVDVGVRHAEAFSVASSVT